MPKSGRFALSLLVVLTLLLQVGFVPAAQAATTTVTLAIPIPEGTDRAEVAIWVNEINGRNDLLSDTIREESEKHPVNLPGAVVDPPDFDGSFTLTSAGLSLTIESEVAATDLNWWERAILTSVAYAGGVILRLACVLTLNSTGVGAVISAPACAFLSTVISNLLSALILRLHSGELTDAEFWKRAAIVAVMNGLAQAAWEAWLGPFSAGTTWSGAFTKIGGYFKSAADWFKNWPAVSALLNKVSGAVGSTQGNSFNLGIWNEAVRRGWVRPTTALRVMPLGDSITHGVGGSPGGVGYRARLWSLLQDDTSELDFVGSKDSGQGSIPDTDHEGHPRWWIDQIDSLAADCAINRYRPNVVVLHIGTNDLANDSDVVAARNRLAKLVRKITDLSPTTTVLVSSLVPSTNQTVNARIGTYNAYLPTIVNTLRAEGRRVRLVGNGSLNLTAADLADSLHPNNNGYRKMADAYHGAINAAMAEGLIMPALPGDPGPCRPDPASPPPPPPGPPPSGPVVEGWNYVGKISADVGATRDQVRFADVNGDGRDDYLVVGDQGQVKAWYNNRAAQGGGWDYAGEIASGSAPRDQVRFADVNGDGRDDYLVVDDQGRVRAWLRTSTGWTSQGEIAPGVGATRDQVRLADVDFDGRADYLVVDDQGRVKAWLNNLGVGGGWSYRGEIASGVGATQTQVRFSDLDGDGRDDYLVVQDWGQIRGWLNDVGGSRPWIYQGDVASSVGAQRTQVILADVNGDARADYLVVGNDGSVSAWLNERYDRPDPWGWQGKIASAGAPRHQVRFADVNGDGRDDYLVVGSQGQVSAWHNTGSTWAWQGEIASGAAPGDQIRFADVNGDNRDDYLVLGEQGQVRAWFNTETGWTSQGEIASGAGARDQVRFGDVNGDGRDDYLVVDAQGRVRAWFNTAADGWVHQGEIASGVGAAGNTVTFADVNGDRRDDYLVIGDQGQIRAWVNNRGGTGSPWLSRGEIASGVGAPRSQIELAELNGDRRADYLVLDDQGGVRAWTNNGAAGSGIVIPMPGDPAPPIPGDPGGWSNGEGGGGGLPLCVANRCPK
ncbi:FG-GAP-like repeat-containing protein [Streptosporangium sp. NPDC002721]|uniref:FG-GAP-like repeat-containing protein n=1 Tax=Streptosporangium sp. NPDC002721 TaxID=3366188 RepID=UPI00369C0380